MKESVAYLKLLESAERPKVQIGCPQHPRIRTSTGVEIGGAYINPPPQMSDDMERLQRVLIKDRRKNGKRRDLRWLWEALVVVEVSASASVGLFMYVSW